jgi:hypothetical protein
LIGSFMGASACGPSVKAATAVLVPIRLPIRRPQRVERAQCSPARMAREGRRCGKLAARPRTQSLRKGTRLGASLAPPPPPAQSRRKNSFGIRPARSRFVPILRGANDENTFKSMEYNRNEGLVLALLGPYITAATSLDAHSISARDGGF